MHWTEPMRACLVHGSQAMKLKLSKIIIDARCGSSEVFSHVKKKCSEDINFKKKLRKIWDTRIDLTRLNKLD